MEIKEGMRVELISMDDKQSPPVGTQGTVRLVDDMGQIHLEGYGLAIIPEVDEFEIIEQ